MWNTPPCGLIREGLIAATVARPAQGDLAPGYGVAKDVCRSYLSVPSLLHVDAALSPHSGTVRLF
jgi:hypothetical protein